MSKIDLNALVNGIRGKVGNAILRKVGSRTILAQKPNPEDRKPPTAAMKIHRDRFRRGAAYARAKMKDEVMKAEYTKIAEQSELMNAFTAAVRDYLKLPEIDSISSTLYQGRVGDKVVIKPMDYQKIKTLTVVIFRADGSVLESGNAIQPEGELDWVYTATQLNGVLTGSKISVLAIDRPGNEVMKEVTL